MATRHAAIHLPPAGMCLPGTRITIDASPEEPILALFNPIDRELVPRGTSATFVCGYDTAQPFRFFTPPARKWFSE